MRSSTLRPFLLYLRSNAHLVAITVVASLVALFTAPGSSHWRDGLPDAVRQLHSRRASRRFGKMRPMDRWQQALRRLDPDRVAAVAAGLCVLVPVLAFAWAAVQGPWRAGSIAAAAGALIIVAAGLYASRLEAPGRP